MCHGECLSVARSRVSKQKSLRRPSCVASGRNTVVFVTDDAGAYLSVFFSGLLCCRARRCGVRVWRVLLVVLILVLTWALSIVSPLLFLPSLHDCLFTGVAERQLAELLCECSGEVRVHSLLSLIARLGVSSALDFHGSLFCLVRGESPPLVCAIPCMLMWRRMRGTAFSASKATL